ncbi:mannosyl-oligosaccharide alpha-1,2-mannosidase [Stygiomarasmius scandens]|uniref:alpha-1,2-Mannosidase n=1 Tax=Marasmiellus scandens TaxID=2682957 RepID=A0ABR1JSN8_9AGAR
MIGGRVLSVNTRWSMHFPTRSLRGPTWYTVEIPSRLPLGDSNSNPGHPPSNSNPNSNWNSLWPGSGSISGTAPAKESDYIYPHSRPASPFLAQVDEEKRAAVVDAFKHAWGHYERKAFGYDEFHPIRGAGTNLTWSGGGIGYTIVDAIDTMYIMGLQTEYETARKWIKEHLNFQRKGAVSTFETTIRVLGGLLSAYYLTNDQLYLDHAEDLGSRLIHAFDTPLGLPVSHVDLLNPGEWKDSMNWLKVCPAEIGTLQLEFRYLAQATGNETYWRKVEKVMEVIDKNVLPNGLVTGDLNIKDGSFINTAIRLGGRVDSYYEYLLKQWLQTNRTEPFYDRMYTKAMQGINDNLVQQTPNQKLTYTAELVAKKGVKVVEWNLVHRQEHLTCFIAGSLMLGATTSGLAPGVIKASVPPRPEEFLARGLRDWNTGTELLETCMKTHDTETGLAAEVATFRVQKMPYGMDEKDWFIAGNVKGSNRAPWDAHYLLRPEIVESLFLAWRMTGDIKYRDYAWNIFQAVEKHCRLADGGYATVINVDSVPVVHEDKQETFFLSETLKYLYLIFSDTSVLPLTEIVFNTEAHPLPVFSPTTIKPGLS